MVLASMTRIYNLDMDYLTASSVIALPMAISVHKLTALHQIKKKAAQEK